MWGNISGLCDWSPGVQGWWQRGPREGGKACHTWVKGPHKASGLDPGSDGEVEKVLRGEWYNQSCALDKSLRPKVELEWSKTPETRRTGRQQVGGPGNRPGLY